MTVVVSVTLCFRVKWNKPSQGTAVTLPAPRAAQPCAPLVLPSEPRCSSLLTPCQAPCTEPAVHVRLHMNMRVRESHCLATARGRRRMSARSIIGDYILNVIEANQMRQHGKRQSPASLTSDAARWRAWAACRARSGSHRARATQHRITSDAARWRGCLPRALRQTLSWVRSRTPSRTSSLPLFSH